ncbi:hypothetical protein GLOIN_2v1480811 [Rhizophagus clarus]|uniref:Uncharacterized protein n=1 Tax=Rhizophagus clarus TaxID=94130 RepID=A0A8H3R1Z5_9GLOM|nr:hypothetical protein GLOIN_2v1480811 [Rhizophagus clarus]
MQDEIQEDDLEAGPGPTTQAHREISHDPARQHNNLRNITVWEGKVQSSNNPKYAFNKQQAEQTKYAEAPYMPQLIEASREAITGVLQEELRRKDQIKTALVVNATYVNYKYKGKGDLTDKANYETKELNTYHRGKMGVLLSEKDIDEHLAKTVSHIDKKISDQLILESGFILRYINYISIEIYPFCRATDRGDES